MISVPVRDAIVFARILFINFLTFFLRCIAMRKAMRDFASTLSPRATAVHRS